jgi:hypothetical protein
VLDGEIVALDAAGRPSFQALLLTLYKRNADNPRGAAMHKPDRIAAFLMFCLLAATRSLNGGEPLRIQVSPAVTRAPAFLTVRVNVEAAADNRLLQVIAESPDFYRSSEIQMDGANTPPLNVFEFRDLPTGLYHVTGVLVGVNGRRAMVSRLAKVEPAFGR